MLDTSYATLKQNSMRYMLKHVEEFERVKAKNHPQFKFMREFFQARSICYQNFYKFYKRFLDADRNPEALLPLRRGPKPKYCNSPLLPDSFDAKVLAYRQQGHNKFVISNALKARFPKEQSCSPSSVYRICRAHGYGKLSQKHQQVKRKIVREKAGSLAHIDCHYLPKGVLKSEPQRRYYVLGVMDDYSRLVWVEVMSSLKAVDTTFAMLDAASVFQDRYGVVFEEALTDNGAEFCGSAQTLDSHPFERLLKHLAIKHRRTKAYRPQTNGKIERFWRTFHEDVIEGAEFEDLEALKQAVFGYNLYFNEHRPHQGIQGQIPQSTLAPREEIF